METFRPFRTVLCVYESLRFVFTIWIFIVLQPEGAAGFPWLALITPGAMFLLIALFLRMSMFRYHAYGSLYIAGKSLSIMTTVFWLFFAKTDMIRGLLFHTAAALIVPGIVFFLLLGDILSVWLVNTFMKSTNGRR